MISRLFVFFAMPASLAFSPTMASPASEQAEKALSYRQSDFTNNIYLDDNPNSKFALISTSSGPHAKLKSNGGEATAFLSAAILKGTPAAVYNIHFKVDYFSPRWAFISAASHDAQGFPQTVNAERQVRNVITCFSSCKYEESFTIRITEADLTLAAKRQAPLNLAFSGGGKTWSLAVPPAEIQALLFRVDAFRQKATGAALPTPSPVAAASAVINKTSIAEFWRGAFLAMPFSDAKSKFPSHRMITGSDWYSLATDVSDNQFGLPLKLTMVFRGDQLSNMFWSLPSANAVSEETALAAYKAATVKLSGLYGSVGQEKIIDLGPDGSRVTRYAFPGGTSEVTLNWSKSFGSNLSIRTAATK